MNFNISKIVLSFCTLPTGGETTPGHVYRAKAVPF